MQGPVLLKLLMEKRGMNPNALANALRSRTVQSQVQRYLAGETKNPRPDTLSPIAKFFGIGVEAFYQPTIAQEIAERLELVAPAQSHSVKEPAPNTDSTYRTPAAAAAPTPIRPTPRLRETVLQLGHLLEPYDETARKAVAMLLHDLAIHPEGAYLAANRISALLEAPGNASPARSTISQ